MSEEHASRTGLLATLNDAMVASIWVAIVLYLLTLLSFLILVVGQPGILTTFAPVQGMSMGAMAIIWVASLALLKLTAVSFAAIAFGLWVWKRRLARRLVEGQAAPRPLAQSSPTGASARG
jgi:hypothetical protein